ncbi:MAG: extracellular solute-binding protein [Chloroflexi bacterium]|nr:extracellular solute-binding protein [Chloroflexota bacterium]
MERISRRQYFGGLGSAAAAAGGLLAAACGGPGGQVAPAKQAGCTASLDLLIPWAPETTMESALQQVTRAFAEKRPGCKVTVVPVPGGGELQQKATTMVAAGTPPGLTSLPPSWTTTFATDRIIRSVDDLFKRDRLRLEDFPPALQRPMSYDNKLWYMSFNANADFVLHWNKKHFREVGLDPEKGPATIAELDDAIKRLTREQGGELKRLGSWAWNFYGHGNTIQAWGYAHGGAFYDEKNDQMTFSSPKIMEAVEWYTGWARRVGDARAKALSGQALPGGTHFFATGNFSIHVLTSTGLFGVQKYDPSLEIGAGPFPGKSRDLAGTVTIGGWGVGAAADNSQREAAWEFMKYVGVDPEGTTSLVRLGGALPAYLPSPGLEVAAKDPNTKPYVDAIRRAKGVQLGYFAPVGLNLAPIQDVIDGKMSAKEALEGIDRDVNVRIKELKLKPR